MEFTGFIASDISRGVFCNCKDTGFNDGFFMARMRDVTFLGTYFSRNIISYMSGDYKLDNTWHMYGRKAEKYNYYEDESYNGKYRYYSNDEYLRGEDKYTTSKKRDLKNMLLSRRRNNYSLDTV
jgi:hypothetical protein